MRSRDGGEPRQVLPVGLEERVEKRPDVADAPADEGMRLERGLHVGRVAATVPPGWRGARRPSRRARARASAGSIGRCGSGCAPSRSIRDGHLDHVVGAELGRSHHRCGRRPPGRRRRRRGARRAAAPRPRCRRRRRDRREVPASCRALGSAYISQQPALEVHDLLGAGVAAALLGEHLVERVVVAQVVRGHRSRARAERPAAGCSSSAIVRRARRGAPGSRRPPVGPRAGDPAQVVEPDMLSSSASGSTPMRARQARWSVIATLHSPMARWPASMSAWVTIPTGFVKSTIQAPGAARRRRQLGELEHDRDGPQRLCQPAGAGRLLADGPEAEGERLVDAGAPAARRRAAGRGRSRRRRRPPPASAVRSSRPPQSMRRSIRPARPPTISRRSASMSWRTSSSIGRRSRRVAEALDQLRGVGAAAADDRDLDAHHDQPQRGIDKLLITL